MFVGISAGKLGALQTEVPFTKDMSGRLLQRTLYYLGLSKTTDEKTLKPELVDCYITNMVKGRILDQNGNNRLPTKEEIAYWLPAFERELWQVKPKKVIALGQLVFDSITEAFMELKVNYPPNIQLIKLKHPRAYGSRGAINKNSDAWLDMLTDYRETLQIQSKCS